jgi:photosystem II stability/assembly factor-like uncharacterized protein
MKTREAVCLLAVLAFSVGETNAQTGWYWQSPLPQGNHLVGVRFISPTVGWAVGEYGTILKTTNGGASWTLQTRETRGSLFGIYFADENTGTAVGYDWWTCDGIILRTTNG